MTSAKMSVAMCTYNGAAYLEAQLKSIAAQTRLPDELVVCDDGSLDGTFRTLECFACTAGFTVRLVRNSSRLGSTANFTQAIGMCGGDIVVLTDQDDVWKPEKLTCIESRFEVEPGIDGLFSNGTLIDAEGERTGSTLWGTVGFTEKKRAAVKGGQGLDVLLQGNFVTGATLAFRGHLKHLLLPIPAGWVHDYWIALLVAAISRLDYIDAELIEYRCHAAQQVGVRDGSKRSVAELWRQYGELNSQACFSAARKWDEISRRLMSEERIRVSSALDKCKAAAEHLRRRGILPRERLYRLPGICREIVNGNYFRYSAGGRSILRDILAR
jgi:glycosyltransferase involved in cell wall biosynthesis